MLSVHSIYCNSMLSLKRAYSASVKLHGNAGIGLALGSSCFNAFGAIRRLTHLALIVENKISEVCELVAQFIASDKCARF